MATYSYKVYKKQVSYDGGSTWYDVDPLETMKMVTGWNVECSGLTYAGRITESKKDCNDNATLYEWFIAEKKNIIERSDVIKTWGGAGAGNVDVEHGTYGGEKYAVNDCETSFSKTLHIMPNCTEIGNRAFAIDQKVPRSSVLKIGISNLNTIVFEGTSTLRKIGENAFYNSDLIGEIDLPDSLEEIESNAFADTSYITHVNIESGITSICSNAFYNSGSSYLSTPKVIRINKTTPPTLSGDSYWMGAQSTIIVPNSSIDAYKSSWFGDDNSVFSSVNVVTSSAKTSHSYEYGGEYSSTSGYADNLTAVTTSNVTRNTNTHWVKFGDSVVEIGESLFGGTSQSSYNKINYVLFGDNLKKIGAHAFENVPLFELEFPNSLEEIGEEAFSKLSINGIWALHMTKLKFGSGLKKIGAGAFWWNQIDKLELPNSLEEIGNNAFHGCRCREITWSSNLKKIGNDAFNGCFIKANTYATGCTDIDVVIPEGVEEVGSNVFGGGVNDSCDTLISSISFPSTLTKIGSLTQYCRYYQDSKLIFLSTTPPQVVDGTMSNAIQVYVPCESVSLYRNTSPFNLYRGNIHAIEEGCTSELRRWSRFGYKDIDGQLYPNEIEQVSYDSGATWENTGQERQSSISAGSASYTTANTVVRYNYMTGATNNIPSLGVTMKVNTVIYLNDTYLYLAWRGGTDGYLIGDGEGNAIIPITGNSPSDYGYYFDLGGNRATASKNGNYKDNKRFGNFYLRYNDGSRDRYWFINTSLDTIETSTNLGLFNGEVAGGVKSIQIYEDSTLVRDFEPRYLTALGTATLYDKVSNTYCEVNGSLSYN